MLPIESIESAGYRVTKSGKIFGKRFKRPLKPQRNRAGYNHVSLCVDGTQVTVSIHRLVAEKYLPNPDNLPEVNHIDENKDNNNVSNLEWVTRVGNMTHGTLQRRISKAHSKKCTDGVTVYESAKVAGETLGLDPSGVAAACRGHRQATCGGKTWRYV